MARRISTILAALTLVAGLCVASAAQVSPYPVPEQGIKGEGAIQLAHGNLGLFEINVARTGSQIFGGFRFTEVTPDGQRVNVVFSRQVVELQINGNVGTARAVGYWNNMLSDITLVALDDLNDDNLHIIARPRNMLPVIYDQQGGVIKGDIVVYGAQPSPDAYTKGYGAIAIPTGTITRVGRFRFDAVSIGGNVRGTLFYSEWNQNATALQRPPVCIYVPRVQFLRVEGNVAVFGGPGAFNGRPANVEVRAVDWSMVNGPIPRPDEFHIKAVAATADTVTPIAYEAGGPLIPGSGDIVVGTFTR